MYFHPIKNVLTYVEEDIFRLYKSLPAELFQYLLSRRGGHIARSYKFLRTIFVPPSVSIYEDPCPGSKVDDCTVFIKEFRGVGSR